MDPLGTPLEIARCRLFEVAVPLRAPFRISGGTLPTRRSLIVELSDRAGTVGYGESAPFEAPFYSEETLATARWCIERHLFPVLAGRSFASLEAAAGVLEHSVRGNRTARAGVETALWDLVSAKLRLPLRALLGAALERMGVPEPLRASRDRVEAGVALGIPEAGDVAALAAEAVAALRRGYRRVKLKVMPGFDLAAVRAVRDATRRSGLEAALWVDANGAYTREADMEALRALDREGLVMIEQPLAPDDVAGTLKLAHELVTPICLDESLTGDRAAELFVEHGGPATWNVKVQRVGGLWESLRIYRRAAEAGARLWAGSMPETGVGLHAVLSLASFAGFVFPTDAEPSERWYEPGADLVEWTMDGAGMIAVRDVAGLAELGVREKLEKVGRAVG
jgi:O-succinylbenzoate synthase